jgi:hypothetical protein
MGFWAGNSNIGNIVGYEFGTSCTDGLNLNWVSNLYILIVLFSICFKHFFVYNGCHHFTISIGETN